MAERTYLFAFFRGEATPRFTRELGCSTDDLAIEEGRSFLAQQRMLPDPATAVAVGRRSGETTDWLGRWEARAREVVWTPV